MALCFAVIGGRLVQLQAVGARHYERLGLGQRVRTTTLPAERGSVFDRTGADLAISVPQHTIVADPRVIREPDVYASRLAPLLGVDARTLRARLAGPGRAFAYVARRVDDATTKKVAALALPGISTIPESKRFYPSDWLAAPVLGFVGTDQNGLAGLEAAYDPALAGQPGTAVLERDPAGRSIPGARHRERPAQRGRDLVLTLDEALQYETEQALTDEVSTARARGGMAVVVNVKTGDVLAMATVDGAGGTVPAHPATGSDRNRPVTDVYEPGSTNKAIVMAAAIEQGLVDPSTTFRVPDTIQLGGVSFADNESHATGTMTVTDILQHSSNVGAIEVAQQLGKQRLDSYLRAFGFGRRSALAFPGEASGLLPSPAQYSATSMGTVPTGNGLAVTAMQMLEVYATIANGGTMQPPRLLAATIDAQGHRHGHRAAPARRVISPATAAAMTQMLEQVVKGGTGTAAAIPGYTVAGKTGTARKPPYDKPPYRYVASFAGFAPAEAPELAAIVVVDEPDNGVIYGGALAAPAFSRIMQYALRHEQIAPALPIGGVDESAGSLHPTTSPTG